MTPKEMEAIYAAAFPESRGWTAAEFQALLDSPHCFIVARNQGFALGRVIADEAELITIATHPDAQGQGIGRQSLQGFQTEAAKRRATTAFLEVAADNAKAIPLYESDGWCRTGLRKGYYTREAGDAVDALLMGKTLT